MLAKAKHESGLQRWTCGSQRRVLCHVSPFVLCLRWHSQQADKALVVVRHTSAARVYKSFQPTHRLDAEHSPSELVARLRQEAQQWKDQCLRLEETLRGEINTWKDQFLRIDAEHTRLLSQLSSQATLAHTPKRVLVTIRTVNSSATSSSTKHASGSSSTGRADKHQCDHRPHTPTPALPPPRVVRRVQAVIEVPVKEEEVEEECCELDTERPPDPASSAGSHHRTEFARSDYVDEGEEGPSDEASGGEYADEEGENAGWQPDEEDDEFMMHASLKDNPRKIHLPRFPRRKSVTNVTAQRLSATNVLAQKRRTTETGLRSAARAKRRR
ncbi:hypothetical protein BJV78DRAFT_1284957 [Lactifluus subvellereus]|nr:hypothetical protein BJV78DRAFT_1284957 [Lactifluus subvellereus]